MWESTRIAKTEKKLFKKKMNEWVFTWKPKSDSQGLKQI
jgi:hypothetical protein